MLQTLLLIMTAVFANLYSLNTPEFRQSFIDQTEIQTLDIPFTTQAPFSEWSDPRQQDGCEEASLLMIAYWLNEQPLTPTTAKTAILNISHFQEDNFGNFIDSSIEDSANQILKTYFDYNHFRLQKNATIQDMIFALSLGNAIVVPTHGQLLQNPYFTSPGPERHMLVIKGYDKSTQEFITNDPGTRHGENFRYKEKILWSAIQDYPTGDHFPILTPNQKTILIIQKI